MALKLVKLADIKNRKQVEHIFNERDIMKMLGPMRVAPQLVQTFRTSSHAAFLMEHINGVSLLALLSSTVYVKTNLARYIAASILSKIEQVHGAGVIYRDLKPENVMLTFTDATTRLVDFGFAKLIKGERTFTLCGSPAYSAPEVIQPSFAS